MVKQQVASWFFVLMVCLFAVAVWAEQGGTIRGMIHDSDFDVPLAAAEIMIAETGQKVVATDEGNYVFSEVKPGVYTVVISKDGYTRQVKADVVVSPGQMAEVNASLSGEFEEMDEFVVQDVQIGTGTEAALLDLRMESPALMDSVSSDLMSQAGASDAASALKLVSGATVQDGKYATIRGLPDRYVNSQMNGVRLPTADSDKRAVQLDQFPAAVIESIQVTKTFTPDQQGDASGGAVNVVLKGIPQESVFKFSFGSSVNSNVADAGSDFLTSKGGGVSAWGRDDGKRDPQLNRIGESWDGAVGISTGDPQTEFKWSVSGGGKYELDEDITIGGFGSFFYEKDNSFYDDGIEDKYWVENPGDPMSPQYSQGSPSDDSFKTSLFDVTQGRQQVQWGGLGVFGIETENNSLSFLYMYTRSTEDVVTLSEDTRGKEYYYPGYDPDDPIGDGNQNLDAAPYLRYETLEYTERTTETFQLSGRHTLPDIEWGIDRLFTVFSPEIDWRISKNTATLYQPDKRQFGSLWWGASYNPGVPPWVPPSTSPEQFRQLKPDASFSLGNLQRVWKNIDEESDQYSINLKLPFEQWSGDEGYLKFGLFDDQVTREYDQDSFSNFNDLLNNYPGSWDEFWSAIWASEEHPILPANIDVDYTGEQQITAWYYMMDVPLNSMFKVIGGTRFEETDLSIINYPEEDVKWIPPGGSGSVDLNPGDADVSFNQKDVLPSIGFEFSPLEQITFRGSYSETVARQTFKELSPILQQEYLGGDVFIGNPELGMSALKNYDLRLDWTPYQGGLFSFSYFHKDIEDPIEYVQRNAGVTYTTPVNYPKGKLSGYEVEFRQKMGHFWDNLEGLSLGANATFIDSEVTLPDDESAGFDELNIRAPMKTRDMTNAPEYLYNLFLTYDLGNYGTQFGLFYTVRGDTLVAGAGQSNGNYIPNIYETEYGSLNFSLSQKLGEIWKLKFQAKNLLDPEIKSVYRYDQGGGDVTKTSYTKGRDFSISLSASF